MNDDQEKKFPEKTYPEDQRLRDIRDDPDRRMTRAEWEQADSLARQAAYKKHDQVRGDREVQQEHDRKKRTERRDWKKILFWVAVGIGVLLLIFIIGYIPRHEREKKAAALAKQREQEQPQVEVVQVKRTRTPGELTVPGTTASLIEAYIYARANGYLRKRFVDIGDHVKQGQLLALIDAPDLDQQVDQAREQLRQAESQVEQQQAQLNLARVTWERWRTLVAKGVFSRQDGDQREADYKAQQAIVASAQRNVESYRANLRHLEALQQYERIIAPFDGVITQRNADVGALVGATGAAASAPSSSSQSPTGGSQSVGSANTSGSTGMSNQSAAPSTGEAQGGPIFAIAQTNKLRILVSVPESYAASVRMGMPAKVFMQERTGKPITGTVTRSANAIDQNTRTMLTEVDVDNRDGSLYPGMYAIVQFVQLPGKPPITVPGDAVIVRQDKTAVAVVREQKIQITPVEIGRDYGPSVEIASGLNEGDLVVTSVTDAVQQGVKVVAKQSQEAQAEGGQSDQIPNAGPSQYGDQSIVNSQSESTNQKSKSAQGQGGGQQGNDKNNNQGGNQKGQDQKTKEKQRKEMKKQQSGSSH
jgi:multidrug efflux pump subunit AcrA (membrane-fusion protein)